MRVRLVPLEGGTPIEVVKDLLLVGRKEDCDIRVEHKSVSKLHCVLVKADGLLLVARSGQYEWHARKRSARPPRGTAAERPTSNRQSALFRTSCRWTTRRQCRTSLRSSWMARRWRSLRSQKNQATWIAIRTWMCRWFARTHCRTPIPKRLPPRTESSAKQDFRQNIPHSRWRRMGRIDGPSALACRAREAGPVVIGKRFLSLTIRTLERHVAHRARVVLVLSGAAAQLARRLAATLTPNSLDRHRTSHRLGGNLGYRSSFAS